MKSEFDNPIKSNFYKQMDRMALNMKWLQDRGILRWAELNIRESSDAPRDCFDVLKKLETSFPELAGFVFWSDDKYYNITGNLHGPEFMSDPKIITLK